MHECLPGRLYNIMVAQYLLFISRIKSLEKEQKLELISIHEDRSIDEDSGQPEAIDPLYDTIPHFETPHTQNKSRPTSGYKEVQCYEKAIIDDVYITS